MAALTDIGDSVALPDMSAFISDAGPGAAVTSSRFPSTCFGAKGGTQPGERSTIEAYVSFSDWCSKHTVSVDVYVAMDGDEHKVL
jgi:hypothetical protein